MTGVGAECSSFAGNYASNIIQPIILKKRNLPMVRLEKTFLPEPSNASNHSNLEYPLVQGQSALLPEGKLASLGM